MKRKRESCPRPLPSDAYLRRRDGLLSELLAQRGQRRIELGPLSLVFENRTSVLFQLQEVLRVEGGPAGRVVEDYEDLLPRPGELTATLFVCGGTPAFGWELSRALADSRGAWVALRLGARRLAARAGAIELGGAVHYLRFPLSLCVLAALRSDQPAAVELGLPAPCLTAALSTRQRRALEADLAESYRGTPLKADLEATFF